MTTETMNKLAWAALGFVIGLGVCLLVGCDVQETVKPTYNITEFPRSNSLITVMHDGHRFVAMLSGNQPIVFMHHPDCCKPPPQ